MESAVNPQPDGPHIRINHQIHREIIRRKFTQRQRDIIDFILTLSWGCGKPSAIIPKLKQFELCGIRKWHIRTELEVLVIKNVIFWDETLNIFQINKHYDQWKVDTVELYDQKLMNELIKYNIENVSPNLLKRVAESATRLPKVQHKKVAKSATKLPKVKLFSCKNGNSIVANKATLIRQFFNPDAAYRVSKTIIKASTKKRTTTTTTEIALDEYPFPRIFQAYQNNFTKNGQIREFEAEELGALFDDYGGKWLLQAMREAFRQSEDKRNLAYVQGVLVGYRKRGGPESTKTKDPPKQEAPSRRTQQQRELDELRRKAREERQRGQS